MFSFTFFFTAAHFHLALVPLAFLILPPLLQSFHVVLPTKKSPLFFFLVELRCLSALYSTFVDMTIDLLSLILYTPRKQKQSPLSVFVVIDS